MLKMLLVKVGPSCLLSKSQDWRGKIDGNSILFLVPVIRGEGRLSPKANYPLTVSGKELLNREFQGCMVRGLHTETAHPTLDSCVGISHMVV